MKTKVIERNEWADFLDSFTRRHEAWRVTLEIFGPEFGDQISERELALEGVTTELAPTGDKIEIMMGAKPDDHLTHTINAPTQVALEQSDEGADLALAIKGADGTTALLRFSSAMLPEMVDATA